MTPRKSNVVLMARIDDPVALSTRGTYSTIVAVEHDPEDTIATVAEMAIEIAPSVDEWAKY